MPTQLTVAMKLRIHAEARRNFNQKATDLIQLVRGASDQQQSLKPYNSEVPVGSIIRDADIIGEIRMTTTDYRGRIVAREFWNDGAHFEISEQNYLLFLQLAEKIQAQPEVFGMLSKQFVEESLFHWVKVRHIDSNLTTSFMDFLDEEALGAVDKLTVWTPVSFLEVESAFSVASSEIRPISRAIVSTWKQQVLDMNPTTKSARDAPEIIRSFEVLMSRIQGLAAVVTTIEAEPQRAKEWAREEAERVTSALALFSKGAFLPDVKCVCRPKGMEHVSQSLAVLVSEGRFLTEEATVDLPSAGFWRLDNKEIASMRSSILDKVSLLMQKRSPNAFEKSVLNSIFLYAKCAFTAEPVEKLVYVLSGLESVLLKNETEPIQQNLAERLAFFLKKGLDERKRVIKIVRGVYGMRSRYLHHGNSLSDLELMTDFLSIAWTFYFQLLVNVTKFQTKDDFICALDDVKLGGTS
jgi:hypothetical protein